MKRLLLLLVFLVACSSSKSSSTPADAAPPQLQTTFGGARPAELRVPANYDPKTPAPLLLVLHGYGSAGIWNDVYIKMSSIADDKGFLYIAPDGMVDSQGKHFWNATDQCCDYDHSNVDDVGYLMGLVAEIRGVYNVDPKRIFVMGHSNGGWMTNRLACDHAEVFAAAVSWAGGNWTDTSKCQPSAPVGYLQVHGTKDSDVPFAGAEPVVALWAQRNGCDATLAATGETLRANSDATAPDTKVSAHGGCQANGAAVLWPVEGADHVFVLTPDAVNGIWSFLLAHAKP